MNADVESIATVALCRRCGEALVPGATVCAACGASVATGTGNVLVFTLACLQTQIG